MAINEVFQQERAVGASFGRPILLSHFPLALPAYKKRRGAFRRAFLYPSHAFRGAFCRLGAGFLHCRPLRETHGYSEEPPAERSGEDPAYQLRPRGRFLLPRAFLRYYAEDRSLHLSFCILRPHSFLADVRILLCRQTAG